MKHYCVHLLAIFAQFDQFTTVHFPVFLSWETLLWHKASQEKISRCRTLEKKPRKQYLMNDVTWEYCTVHEKTLSVTKPNKHCYPLQRENRWLIWSEMAWVNSITPLNKVGIGHFAGQNSIVLNSNQYVTRGHYQCHTLRLLWGLFSPHCHLKQNTGSTESLFFPQNLIVNKKKGKCRLQREYTVMLLNNSQVISAYSKQLPMSLTVIHPHTRTKWRGLFG